MHHSCFALILLCFLTACHLRLSLAGPRNLCVLPVSVGSCRGYFPKWFYNTTSARCETFIYGGCQGNLNRFDTKESCESTCVCDRCILQPETGLCRARIPSYFYNTISGNCEQFIYGGCDGNDNRFKTAAACAQHCYYNASCPIKGQVFENCPSCQGTCDNPVVSCPVACTGGGCVCPPGQLVDTEANECVHPSQCPVKCSNVQCPKVNCHNENATIPPGSCCPVCACKFKDEVRLPGEPFKIDCNFCKCASTGLSFCTKIACQESLSPPSNKTICPIEGQEYTECGTGCPLTCKALDPVPCTRQCVPGCQCPRGTVLDEDNKRCVEHCLIPPCQRAMCTLQPETGPCRAFIESYFWNVTTRQCERFTYGGCGGNFNRFSDIKSCANQCACADHKCNKGSYCKVYEPTGQPYCEASCDLNNGGCPADKTCSLHNVSCDQATPCPPVVNCTDRDPCEYHECPTGSKCKMFEANGETYCEPSCDLENGGCAANQTCSLQVVQCIRAPCPFVVKCQAKCPIEGQEYTDCGTACPPTCSEPKPRICRQQCMAGCQCPSDTLLDEVQNKCVKVGQCTCPPTCSHEYCSRRRNRKKPCSRPPPHTVSPCPNQCHSTYCNACYYSKRRRNTPQKCNKRVCTGEEVTPNCLRRWAKCVNKHNSRKNKCDGDCITSENFRCYDYPPCSNLLG